MNQILIDLETEMEHTPWEKACRDPHMDWAGQPRKCRRAKNHTGQHAAGYVSSGTLYLW